MNPTSTLKREVAAYLGIVYLLAIVVAIALPHEQINQVLSVLVPVATVAILTFTITPRGQRRCLWRAFGLQRAGFPAWLGAIVIPIGLCAGAYGSAIAVGAGQLHIDLSGNFASGSINLIISAVIGTVFILGEEIGWRGYLLPRVQQLSVDRRWAAVVTGLMHGCFHLPLILIGTTYDNEVSRWVAAPVAVTLITAGGVFYAWVWDRSETVWPVAIAHNTVNTVFDVGASTVLATGGVNIAYVAGETGFATLGVCIVAATLLCRYARVWRSPQAQPGRRPAPLSATATATA